MHRCSGLVRIKTFQNVNWSDEFKKVQDKRVSQDLIKYKITQRTITYRKGKVHERRAKLQKVEDKLKECTEKCDIDPYSGNLEELECPKTEYDQLYDYITQGGIIRFRVTWYEMGEKKNVYLYTLKP